jgi:hypothetical protein
MRKTLIITLALCVVAAIAAYGQAPATGGAAATTGTATTGTGGAMATTGTTGTAHKASKSHKAAAGKKYNGEVASVDATAKSFVVHPKKGEDVTLKVNDKTKYSPKGKGWDDVTAGAKVSGGYKNDGTDNWATTVHFAAAKASKASAAAKPAPKTGK